MDNKMKFIKHLKEQKDHLREIILDITDEESNFSEFTSKKIQEIANELKEIETLENFVLSDDFNKISFKKIVINMKKN